MSRLNPRQQEAVNYVGGPLLVLAGAGSGKTSVITRKIAYLIQHCGIQARHIVAMTFTNKAAREMKLRVGRMLGEVVEGMPWMGTFHSLSVKILRRHAELVGLKSSFTILDTDDQERVCKQVLEAEGLIVREPVPDDRRAIRLRLTPAKPLKSGILISTNSILPRSFGPSQLISRRHKAQLPSKNSFFIV